MYSGNLRHWTYQSSGVSSHRPSEPQGCGHGAGQAGKGLPGQEGEGCKTRYRR